MTAVLSWLLLGFDRLLFEGIYTFSNLDTYDGEWKNDLGDLTFISGWPVKLSAVTSGWQRRLQLSRQRRLHWRVQGDCRHASCFTCLPASLHLDSRSAFLSNLCWMLPSSSPSLSLSLLIRQLGW